MPREETKGLMPDEDYETFDGARCIAESGKAIRVELSGGTRHWIPKSMLSEDSEVYKLDEETGKLIVKSWFCEREGIE